MSKNILVAVAWPYASGSRHLGHIGGAYLPADIFARYHRVIGNDVLMVSGSDVHGTPITVRADAEGVKPIDIVNKYHKEFLVKLRDLNEINHFRSIFQSIIKSFDSISKYRSVRITVDVDPI